MCSGRIPPYTTYKKSLSATRVSRPAPSAASVRHPSIYRHRHHQKSSVNNSIGTKKKHNLLIRNIKRSRAYLSTRHLHRCQRWSRRISQIQIQTQLLLRRRRRVASSLSTHGSSSLRCRIPGTRHVRTQETARKFDSIPNSS